MSIWGGRIDQMRTSQMKTMIAAVALALLSSGPTLALSQTSSTGGLIARTLESRNIQGTNREMVLREVTIPPGAAVPLHHHTVPGLVFIVEGVAESAYGNDRPRLYRAGETLQDQAEIPHTLFRNADLNKPLRILTFYVAAKGQPYVETP
jgi:quercetin dioxygenase-like cupin family protein